MKTPLYDLLDLIQYYQLQALIIALVVYVFTYCKRDSVALTLLLVIGLSLTHFGLEVLHDKAKSMSYGVRLFSYHMWYIGFSVTDFAFFFILKKCHEWLNLRMHKIAYTAAGCLIARGFIQILRYGDREVFETDWLAYVYQLTIPLINSVFTTLAVLTVAVAFFYKLALHIKGRGSL